MPLTQLPTYDLNFHAGDTEYLALQYKDANGELIGIKSGVLQIRDKVFSDNPLVTCQATISEDFTAYFKFTPEMTLSLRPNSRASARYFYDAKVVTLNDDTKTLVQGIVNVTYNITETVVYTNRVQTDREIARDTARTRGRRHA